jgi:anti-anti-sigma regulatory factor
MVMWEGAMSELQAELVMSGIGRARLLCGGVLDLATAPALLARAAEVLADATVQILIIDLNEVTLGDELGPQAIAELRDEVRTLGKTLTVVNAPW